MLWSRSAGSGVRFGSSSRRRSRSEEGEWICELRDEEGAWVCEVAKRSWRKYGVCFQSDVGGHEVSARNFKVRGDSRRTVLAELTRVLQAAPMIDTVIEDVLEASPAG